MLTTLVLLALLAVAAATDLVRHKIYNATTYPGIVVGLVSSAATSAAIGLGLVDQSTARQWFGVTLSESALGLLACGFVLLLALVMFRVGGGDVKLMAMVGALCGVEDGLKIMLWTFVLGACAAVIVLVWRVGPGRLALRIGRQAVYALRIGGVGPLSADERNELRAPLYLAPCAFAATLIVKLQLVERFG